MGLGFGITGNEAFDWFIAESAQKRDEVMNLFNKSQEKYINNILISLNLDRQDFTDLDWNYISQYID